MTWGQPPTEAHLSETILATYVDGGASPAAAAAVDLHVQSCMACRYRVNREAMALDPDRTECNLLAVAAAIDAPRPRLVERTIARVGVSTETARLLAATPSLRRSWFIAIGVVLLFALAAANPDRPNTSVVWFLALAPLLPVVGVALAYGPGVDPSYEITLASPISGLRLVLLRTIAVLATSMALTGFVALLIAGRHQGVIAAWFVPGLMASALCLALMTRLAPRVAGASVAGAWLVLVIAVSTRASDELALFRPAPQLAMALVGAAAAVAVVMRRDSFDVAAPEVG